MGNVRYSRLIGQFNMRRQMERGVHDQQFVVFCPEQRHSYELTSIFNLSSIKSCTGVAWVFLESGNLIHVTVYGSEMPSPVDKCFRPCNRRPSQHPEMSHFLRYGQAPGCALHQRHLWVAVRDCVCFFFVWFGLVLFFWSHVQADWDLENGRFGTGILGLRLGRVAVGGGK